MISPVPCRDLAGSPEALILLAKAGPLRDEGVLYAQRLQQAGVRATAKVYPGLVHGVWQLGAAIPEARPAVEDADAAIRSCFPTAKAAFGPGS